ncbi:methylated-DNA--[protein]-cysteine S-methyltransferase [Haliea sp. E17]|uniref:methylated-DNA--[protein]-cysteine S-methyltransferase n=1 Tax=Haliea sp. E17 TaxID=3401576 RepID=UPI003AAF87A8
MSDYQRVEKAIDYLATHCEQQPSLDQVAAHLNLSPFHFQRLFSRWAGTTPKRFLQALTVERGKALLQQSRNLAETSAALGLSGSSRLHDHFVQLEALTPGELRAGGANLTVRYGVQDSPFGPLFLAVTERGICKAGFADHTPPEQQLLELSRSQPHAVLTEDPAYTAQLARTLFNPAPRHAQPISLQVSGTNFQIAVWRALLEIPEGCLQSYGDLARRIGRQGAERAVGNAVGANPVAYFIPCHRVIRESGALGGYRWGTSRKRVVLAWEQARTPEPAA